MPEVVTEIIIDASAERVWHTLVDLEAYPGWNPVIRRISGPLGFEQAVAVTRIGADGREVTEHPTVTHYRPQREIRWRTRMGLPWLLDTEVSFKIERLGPTQVRFVHWQARTGLLALLTPGASESAVRDRFDVMNLALKARAEHDAVLSPEPEAHAAHEGQPAASAI
jgi:hypothetical protein